MSSKTQILLLGAGELGTAFLPHLSSLPNIHITIGVRTPSKYTHLTSHNNITLIPLNTNSPSSELSSLFADYDIVISCTGFGQPISTFPKLTNEILQAGKLRKEAGKGRLWFFPWQWGLDYDQTGDGEGLMPLFGVQVQVRNLLREQASACNVKWTIVSTGIFMSFLFEQFWGVVDREGEQITVRALRDWDHKVTVTDVNDIGKVLGRVVAGDLKDEDCDNRIVYAAGDTVSYAQLADIVERVTGKAVKREKWTIQYLEEELAKDPADDIKKYRVVFARPRGIWWDKEVSANYRLGIPVTGVETYAKENL